MDISTYVIEFGGKKLDYYRKKANAVSIEIPLGIVKLKDGTECQVQIRVITDKDDFLGEEQFEIDLS